MISVAERAIASFSGILKDMKYFEMKNTKRREKR